MVDFHLSNFGYFEKVGHFCILFWACLARVPKSMLFLVFFRGVFCGVFSILSAIYCFVFVFRVGEDSVSDHVFQFGI